MLLGCICTPSDRNSSGVGIRTLECVPVHFLQARVTDSLCVCICMSVSVLEFAHCGHHSALTLGRLRYLIRESSISILTFIFRVEN